MYLSFCLSINLHVCLFGLFVCVCVYVCVYVCVCVYVYVCVCVCVCVWNNDIEKIQKKKKMFAKTFLSYYLEPKLIVSAKPSKDLPM